MTLDVAVVVRPHTLWDYNESHSRDCPDYIDWSTKKAAGQHNTDR